MSGLDDVVTQNHANFLAVGEMFGEIEGLGNSASPS